MCLGTARRNVLRANVGGVYVGLPYLAQIFLKAVIRLLTTDPASTRRRSMHDGPVMIEREGKLEGTEARA